jgi:hypothetical protein
MSGALTSGVAASGLTTDGGTRWDAHLGGRADALFLRDRAERMAVGPYAELLTVGLGSMEVGGGAEWLVPAWDTAFVFSAGGFAKSSRRGWEPGVAAGIFWGSRSFNYHSVYALGVGLFVQGRTTAGTGVDDNSVLAGVHVDLEYLALPWMLAYQALRR